MQTATAATLSGIVADSSSRPIEGARIDHTGKRVLVTPDDVAVKPLLDESRTNAQGRFQITPNAPAIVIRKPGYESQRVRITADTQVQVTLRRIKALPGCKLAQLPPVKTKQANDIDYTATWFYVDTKEGPRGIIRGSGPSYSWGAPTDSDVWQSVEYFEVMYESGVIDARGHTADNKYWRSQTSFGRATQYYGVDKATAELLDCIMDRVPMKIP